MSGTGTQSNTFFVLNATLQHEDNQDIASHLNAFKKRAWTSDAFPLTHRPDNYHVTPMDSDFFPIVYTGADRPASIVLNYRYRNQSTWRTSGPSTFASFTPAKSVFYIPDGPANLHPLFAPNFGDIAEYYLEVKDTTGAIIATTNIMTVNGCEDDYFRIHFLNRLGAIDAINFHVTDITQEVKSDTTERPTTTPLVKSQHAVRRFSVRSNDKHTGLNQEFHEEDLDFVDELFASPLHWLQWKGTQSQVDDYIPIVLSDQKNMKRKAEDRYSYDVTVEFTLSHEKFIIRN